MTKSEISVVEGLLMTAEYLRDGMMFPDEYTETQNALISTIKKLGEGKFK